MRREGGAVTVSPGCTSAHMTHLIMPQHANSLGITFGGQVTTFRSRISLFPLYGLFMSNCIKFSQGAKCGDG